MEKIKFAVSKRQNKKNNLLRKEGIVPANMYQANKESMALELNGLAFLKLTRTLSENAIVYLQIQGEKGEAPVLVDEIQRDVFGKKILHVVFRKINLSEKIKADIPVELLGEFEVDNGVLVLVKDSIEVEALPTDLPEKFEIDQSQLKNIGDQVLLSSLNFDHDKVTLILGEAELAEEIVVALVQEKAEEVEEVSTDLVEPEIVGDKKAEDDSAEAVEQSAT